MRSFSNSTPSALQRAISAYRKLDLTKPRSERKPRALPKRAVHLNSWQLDQLAKRYQLGASVYELADDFDIDRRTVSLQLRQLGVDMRQKSPSAEQVDQMAALYQSGLSFATIGEKLSVDGGTVRRCLAKAGIPIRPRRGWQY